MRKLKILITLFTMSCLVGVNFIRLNADPNYVYAKSLQQSEIIDYNFGLGGNVSLDPSGANGGVEGKAEKTVKGVRYHCSWDFAKCDTNEQRTEWFN